jgi:hypothetical protein
MIGCLLFIQLFIYFSIALSLGQCNSFKNEKSTILVLQRRYSTPQLQQQQNLFCVTFFLLFYIVGTSLRRRSGY